MALKPGLHIVVTIAEYASDDATKRILRLSTHRLQIFLEKYGYLRSLPLCEDQVPREKPKKRVCNHVLAILTTQMWRPGFSHFTAHKKLPISNYL